MFPFFFFGGEGFQATSDFKIKVLPSDTFMQNIESRQSFFDISIASIGLEMVLLTKIMLKTGALLRQHD